MRPSEVYSRAQVAGRQHPQFGLADLQLPGGHLRARLGEDRGHALLLLQVHRTAAAGWRRDSWGPPSPAPDMDQLVAALWDSLAQD